VVEALASVGALEDEMERLHRTAFPGRVFRSRLVARAEAYLLLRTNLYAELGAPMTMRERRQTLAWFEHRREG
jgi:hypothetical protein